MKQPAMSTEPQSEELLQPLSTIEKDLLRNEVVEAIKTCYDPEIPVNIYDMGLIYEIAIGDRGEVTVTMTLTSPQCPAAQSLPGDVQTRVWAVKGVKSVQVLVTWTPTWNTTMMSDAARLELGFM